MQTSNSTRLLLFFAGFLLTGPLSVAQDTLRTDNTTIIVGQSKIVSSVPFDGINCCIKIVPLTTRNIDHMPTVSPFTPQRESWNVKTYPALPDSFINRLRKLEQERKNQNFLR